MADTLKDFPLPLERPRLLKSRPIDALLSPPGHPLEGLSHELGFIFVDDEHLALHLVSEWGLATIRLAFFGGDPHPQKRQSLLEALLRGNGAVAILRADPFLRAERNKRKAGKEDETKKGPVARLMGSHPGISNMSIRTL